MPGRSFILRAKESGRNVFLWPVSDGGKLGLEVNMETDAWPRKASFEIQHADDATDWAMKDVRQRLGWPNDAFTLAVSDVSPSGRLRFSGVDTEALPAGLYSFKLQVDGFKRVRFRKIRVSDTGEPVLTIDYRKEDTRTVRVDLPNMDPEIRTVLESPASSIDMLPPLAWLEEDRKRPSRKACLLNVVAKLRAADPSNELIRGVKRVFLVDVDRIYVEINPAFHTRLTQLVGAGRFAKDNHAVHETHKRLLLRAPRHQAQYDLASYREAAKPSLQCVVAVPQNPAEPFYADVDIDRGYMGSLDGLIIHAGEVANPDPTSHLNLRDELVLGNSAAFLSYDIVA